MSLIVHCTYDKSADKKNYIWPNQKHTYLGLGLGQQTTTCSYTKWGLEIRGWEIFQTARVGLSVAPGLRLFSTILVWHISLPHCRKIQITLCAPIDANARHCSEFHASDTHNLSACLGAQNFPHMNPLVSLFCEYKDTWTTMYGSEQSQKLADCSCLVTTPSDKGGIKESAEFARGGGGMWFSCLDCPC